ncbi:asparagine synthase-related protein, partial [Escherichia coli]|nr:asparagine synthase-related protein [Escherichia coli]
MTMFSGVEHVMPGSYLSISNSGIEEVSWWDVADVNPEEASEAAWIEQLDTTLDDAVRLRLRADVPFGAFLSGGVDS